MASSVIVCWNFKRGVGQVRPVSELAALPPLRGASLLTSPDLPVLLA